jgi:hypothetical protein
MDQNRSYCGVPIEVGLSLAAGLRAETKRCSPGHRSVRLGYLLPIVPSIRCVAVPAELLRHNRRDERMVH